ncbi:MAG: MAPEG family protein [Pseudomonadota bacterium]|nr:MAPEG family protein [Pseudomonadota bacterium]
MDPFYWFAVFVAANALMVIALALNVSSLRIRLKVANGDGGRVELKRAIRAHANGVEHVTMFGLIVLALSLLAAQDTWLAALVGAFTLARILHAAGMLASQFNLRRVGASVTYLAELAGVLLLLRYLV